MRRPQQRGDWLPVPDRVAVNDTRRADHDVQVFPRRVIDRDAAAEISDGDDGWQHRVIRDCRDARVQFYDGVRLSRVFDTVHVPAADADVVVLAPFFVLNGAVS